MTVGRHDTARTVPVREVTRLSWAALVLSVLGLLVSAYLVYEHFTSATTFACPGNGAINCVKVTTSSYATFLGVPVALLGLAFYAGMTVLSLPRVAQIPGVRRLRLIGTAGGVAFMIYLVWAELFRVDAICLWCTAVHLITLTLFGVLAVQAALEPATDS